MVDKVIIIEELLPFLFAGPKIIWAYLLSACLDLLNFLLLSWTIKTQFTWADLQKKLGPRLLIYSIVSWVSSSWFFQSVSQLSLPLSFSPPATLILLLSTQLLVKKEKEREREELRPYLWPLRAIQPLKRLAPSVSRLSLASSSDVRCFCCCYCCCYCCFIHRKRKIRLGTSCIHVAICFERVRVYVPTHVCSAGLQWPGFFFLCKYGVHFLEI